MCSKFVDERTLPPRCRPPAPLHVLRQAQSQPRRCEEAPPHCIVSCETEIGEEDMAKGQAGNHPVVGTQKQAADSRLPENAGSVVAPGPDVIARDPEILEGKPFLSGTRMGVHAVIGYWQTYGDDVDRILREFPHLTRGQLDAALAFYREDEDQRAEIDQILRQNRAAYEEGLALQMAIR
jgi:uncharacterized protein (DUF433 family)